MIGAILLTDNLCFVSDFNVYYFKYRGSRHGEMPLEYLPLSCHRCGRRYKKRHSLVRHVQYECGGQKKYTCHLCPAKYTQNGNLRLHFIKAHNIDVPANKKFIPAFFHR